jgi:hypothetical protein
VEHTPRFKLLLVVVAAALFVVLVKELKRTSREAPPSSLVAPVAAAPSPLPPPAPPVAPAPDPAPAPSHPPGPDRSPSTTAPPPPPGSEAAKPLNESVLMARLRSVAGNDYPLAVELARAGNRRFPDSADAPERASLLIHALAAQGMAKEARGEAEYAVNHYPDSQWVREIEGFTGAHRHRNLILTDGGVIQAQ